MKKLLILILLISCTNNEDMNIPLIVTSGAGQEEIVTTPFRTACFNIYLGFGTISKKAIIKKHIDRADADFVTLTEVNTSGSDWTYVQAEYLATYPYMARVIGGSLEVMFMSKNPIIASEEITMSGRNPLYAEVEVGGKKIAIVGHHNASWCVSGPCNTLPTELPFEPNAHDRCVQLYDTLNFLKAKKLADADLKGFILQGDWNDDTTHTQVATYSSAPPGGIALPTGVTYPLNNAQFPLAPLADVKGYNGNMTLNLSTDLAGSQFTIWDNTPNAALTLAMRMDYIAYSDEIQLIGGEILNSEVDANTGLSKVGSPLDSGDSRFVSDHKFVFGDFEV